MSLDLKILIGSKNDHFHYISEKYINLIGSFLLWLTGCNKFSK